MDLTFELLLKVLGAGGIVLLISRIELADKLYQVTRNLPQPWADIGALVTIGIILYAANQA